MSFVDKIIQHLIAPRGVTWVREIIAGGRGAFGNANWVIRQRTAEHIVLAAQWALRFIFIRIPKWAGRVCFCNYNR